VGAVTVYSAPDDGRKGLPKHVEQSIISAIKPLLHLVGILFPHILKQSLKEKNIKNFLLSNFP